MPNHNARKTVKLSQIIRAAAFVRGYQDGRAGKPFAYDLFDGDKAAQWHYERGRLLAVTYNGELKDGRKVTRSAVVALSHAVNSGSVI